MPRLSVSMRWADLCLLNFPVDDAVLEPLRPDGVELDRFQGRAYLSLVALHYQDVRALGIPLPGMREFPGVNVRFYVRQSVQGRPAHRGVTFLRELVPKRLMARLARWTFNEPFALARMRGHVSPSGETGVRIEHEFEFGGAVHALRVDATGPAWRPPADSPEHFFKERHWSAGRRRDGTTSWLHVEHPAWEVRAVRGFDLAVDWERLLGPRFAFLQGVAPESVVQAVGSRVDVPGGAA